MAVLKKNSILLYSKYNFIEKYIGMRVYMYILPILYIYIYI